MLSARNYKRVVIKIGASLFCSQGSSFDDRVLSGIAEQIMQLAKGGKEAVIVSSGAIAMGMHFLGLKERPRQLHHLQAASAIGQNELMNQYRRLFGSRLCTAQVLLTWDDFSDRRRYLNAKNTLLALLGYATVPIVNENDTVSTDEIKFGDNDRLSALVASLINADLLIILSDVDGLLKKDKKTTVKLVEEITPQIKALACPTNKITCVGGMITKIEAARMATESGIPCLIANGRKKDIILSALDNPVDCGTLFMPVKKHLKARERWLAFGVRPKAGIVVDEGAKQALLDKKSLLAVGVAAIDGVFQSGDVISIKDRRDKEFARGKVSVSSHKLDEVKGCRYPKEIIHRDNIAIL